jgi:hypothetical protein
MRLYIASENLIVNVDQEQNLPTLTQKKTGNLRITVTILYRCLTIFAVEKNVYIL